MAKVEAEDVGSGEEEFLNHFLVARSRAKGNDLFSALAPPLGHFRSSYDSRELGSSSLGGCRLESRSNRESRRGRESLNGIGAT